MLDFTQTMPEFANNPAQRTPVLMLLDRSGSMSGTKIVELNAGLRAYLHAIRNDDTAAVSVETALVTFGPVQLEHDFATVHELELPSLEAQGQTPLGEAIDFGLDQLEARKELYREHGVPYFRPWVLLITDGAPTDGNEWRKAARRIHEAEAARKLNFFAIGVQGADMDILTDLAPPNRRPLMLQGLKFRELFLWLSASVGIVSRSRNAGGDEELPDISGWARVGVR